VAVGWEALEQWGDDVVRGERLTGGAGVNGVRRLRVNGHLAVGRLGQRSDADQLHRLTQGWPQRPGWRSSADLLHAETGTRVNLGAMPPDGVARCRAAWARLTGRTTCVVHGDPNPGNIRMTADRVAMIDWDESHVDVPDLDLALPHNGAGLGNDAYDIAAQARAAWEAAVCWDPSGTDQFAVRRLAEVRPI
jgi:hypothetical protein